MNDRNTLNGDSAETEASATFTEASAEASAESLTLKHLKNRRISVLLILQIFPIKKKKIPIIKFNWKFNQLAINQTESTLTKLKFGQKLVNCRKKVQN